MPASISTAAAVQIGATTDLIITGVGTDFTGSPITANAGTIVSQAIISPAQVEISFAAPSSPIEIVFTDLGSMAACTVLVRALPILERIRQALVSAVGQISEENGFFTTPTVQELACANGDANNLIVIGLGESDPLPAPEMKLRSRQRFYAYGYILGQDQSPDSIDQQLFLLYSDIYKSVTIDRTRGQLAFDTTPGEPEPESNSQEAQFRVIVPIDVEYRTLENDLTVLG